MTQYGVCCCLPFFTCHFFAKGKHGWRQCPEGCYVAYSVIQVPCIYSIFG